MIINEKDYSGYSIFITHHRTNNFPDPKIMEELIVRRAKDLNMVQTTYAWGNPFPNT